MLQGRTAPANKKKVGIVMKEVLSRCGFKCFAERELPEKSTRGEYNYLLVIHYKNGKKTIKIGTTNNMARRMYEHHRLLDFSLLLKIYYFEG